MTADQLEVLVRGGEDRAGHEVDGAQPRRDRVPAAREEDVARSTTRHRVQHGAAHPGPVRQEYGLGRLLLEHLGAAVSGQRRQPHHKRAGPRDGRHGEGGHLRADSAWRPPRLHLQPHRVQSQDAGQLLQRADGEPARAADQSVAV
jgi:hypothetical protein